MWTRQHHRIRLQFLHAFVPGEVAERIMKAGGLGERRTVTSLGDKEIVRLEKRRRRYRSGLLQDCSGRRWDSAIGPPRIMEKFREAGRTSSCAEGRLQSSGTSCQGSYMIV